MARVMAVSFTRYGRRHYLDAGEEAYAVGDRVLVPTDGGPEVAECVWAPESVAEVDFGALPGCAGRADQSHLDRDAANRQVRAEARLVARRLIQRHGLPMKVLGIDYLDSGTDFDKLIVVYFIAPHRVDFRALVSDLARALCSRIDLRQVGSRDGARLVGGLGGCGRELCCATFLSGFEPVSLRMAKMQDLPANPLRISGACGRLMCCLKFEHPLYADATLPGKPVGSQESTPEGTDTLVGHQLPDDHQVPDDAVLIRVGGGGVQVCTQADACASRAAYQSRDAEPR